MDTKKLEALAENLRKNLEQEAQRGVRLTPAGERIYPLIRQVLSASQALDREVALINSHKEDTIRVAAYSSIAMHWLPEVIQQFRRSTRS